MVMKKLYQNIKVPGRRLPYEDTRRKDSNFWNEGKWNNFINPLLPRYCKNKTFIEIGSSAGMFLKMAEDKGFKHVIGIEANPDRIGEAELYKKSNKGRYKLLPKRMDQGFDFNTIPLAHVTLISNTHYYLSVINFSRVVDALRSRSLYCLVVSAKARRIPGCARYDLKSVRGYFKDWKEINTVSNLETKDDPSPRDKMYGVLFKGVLEEYDTKKLYTKWREGHAGAKTWRKEAMPDSLGDFYKRVLSEENLDLKDTDYYRYWEKRRPDQTEKWILRKVGQKARLAKHIRDNGMFSPIYLSETNWRYGEGRLIDGQHRLCIAHVLGHKSILVRTL